MKIIKIIALSLFIIPQLMAQDIKYSFDGILKYPLNLDSVPGNGLRGAYYNGIHFDTRAHVRNDEEINFEWSHRSPTQPRWLFFNPEESNVYPYHMAVRWEGRIYIDSTRIYEFILHADDGVRVWINNIKVIDEWGAGDTTKISSEKINLEGGSFYDIRIEYYQAGRDAVAKLFWKYGENLGDLAKELEKVVPQNQLFTLDHEIFKNIKFTLNNITFETGKSTLLPSSFPELNRLVGILRFNPHMIIKINGHTDDVGGADYNQRLSEMRAKAVASYLMEKGIERDRVEYEGFGETSPLNNNSTEEEREQNRRVEFEQI